MSDLDQLDALARYDSAELLSRAQDWRSRFHSLPPLANTHSQERHATPDDDQALLILLPPELMGLGRLAAEIGRQYGRPCWIAQQPLVLGQAPTAAMAMLPHTELLQTVATLESGAGQLPEATQANLHPLKDISAAAHPTSIFLALLSHCLERIDTDTETDTRPKAPSSALTGALDACSPHVPGDGNPAKQLALRLHERLPIFFGEGSSAAVAQDWATRRLWYAESTAWAATSAELARNHVLARLPRYWPNTATWVYISPNPAGANASSQGAAPLQEETGQENRPQTPQHGLATAALHLLQRRRFPTTMATPPVVMPDILATLYLLELGEWIALYAACLNNVDPAHRVPHQILFTAE